MYKTGWENGDSYAFNKIKTYGARVNVGKGLSRNVRIGLGTKLEHVTSDPKDGFLGKEGHNGIPYYEDKYYVWGITPSITYDSRNSFFNPKC